MKTDNHIIEYSNDLHQVNHLYILMQSSEFITKRIQNILL